MLATVTTELPCSVDRARDAVLTSRLLMHVSWPLTAIRPVDPPGLPKTWSEGDHLVSMRLLGLVPLGGQTISISISFPPTSPDRLLLRDNGSGQLLRRWDHLITIEPGTQPGRARYTDRIDVEAGRLTVVAWAFAHVLYRWRQRRWRRLASRDLAYRTPLRPGTRRRAPGLPGQDGAQRPCPAIPPVLTCRGRSPDPSVSAMSARRARPATAALERGVADAGRPARADGAGTARPTTPPGDSASCVSRTPLVIPRAPSGTGHAAAERFAGKGAAEVLTTHGTS